FRVLVSAFLRRERIASRIQCSWPRPRRLLPCRQRSTIMLDACCLQSMSCVRSRLQLQVLLPGKRNATVSLAPARICPPSISASNCGNPSTALSAGRTQQNRSPPPPAFGHLPRDITGEESFHSSGQGAVQTKFAASSILPVPLYFATCG